MAALTALYVQDAGELKYSEELFKVLAGQIYEAVEVIDGALEKL